MLLRLDIPFLSPLLMVSALEAKLCHEAFSNKNKCNIIHTHKCQTDTEMHRKINLPCKIMESTTRRQLWLGLGSVFHTSDWWWWILAGSIWRQANWKSREERCASVPQQPYDSTTKGINTQPSVGLPLFCPQGSRPCHHTLLLEYFHDKVGMWWKSQLQQVVPTPS